MLFRGNLAATMDALAPVLFVLFNFVSGCQIPPWVLKRADPGSSNLMFHNETATGSYTFVRWTWRDSSDGLWDTRLKITFNQEEIVGGGFIYTDKFENELAQVRWYKVNRNGPIKWRFSSSASPPDSWWMTSTAPWGNVTWGFKNKITDGSWVFIVGNDTLEPKNMQNTDGWPQIMNTRWKRSLTSDHRGETNNLRKERRDDSAKVREFDGDEADEVLQMLIKYVTAFFQLLQTGNGVLTSIFQMSNRSPA